LQDNKGFIWFGTEKGLNRYDGYKVTVYKSDPNNPSSLSDNHILTLYETSHFIEGITKTFLWIGTRTGLNRFDPLTQKFTLYNFHDQNSAMLEPDTVRAISKDDTGLLWIGTDDGLIKFDLASKSQKRYRHQASGASSLANNRIKTICIDSDNNVWIGHNTGISLYSRENDNFLNYTHLPGSVSSQVSSIIEHPSSTNILFIASFDGTLYTFNKTSKTFRLIEKGMSFLKTRKIHQILFDGKGTLWIVSDNGLHQCDKIDTGNESVNTVTSYYHDIRDNNSISSNFIWTIFEDDAGLLWIGTNVGVDKFIRPQKAFRQLLHDPQNLNSLDNNIVRSIWQDRSGILWVGTLTGGLNKINRKTGSVTHFQHDPQNSNSLPPGTIYAIFEDKSGTLWLCSYESGLIEFDRKRNYFHYFLNNPTNNSLVHNATTAIAEDSSGKLWIGTDGGLSQFDRLNRYFINYVHRPDDPYSLSSNSIQSKTVFEDHKGNIWLGTFGGGINVLLARYKNSNPNEARFLHFEHDKLNTSTISSDYIISLLETKEDENQVIWAGTFGEGLNKIVLDHKLKDSDRFQTGNYKVIRYSTNNGLYADVIYGILQDKDKNIWLSTNQGLYKFNPITESFRIYDVEQGLQSNEFFWGAFYQADDGELFFGGTNGLVSFYPNLVVDESYPPRVVFTDVKIFNRSIDINQSDTIIPKRRFFSFSRTGANDVGLSLNYRDNVVTFEFAALNYIAPDKNQYSYMMEGIDNGWVYSGSRRIVTYTNLSPGEYTFRVKASSHDGVWNDRDQTLSIVISPPFWKTWWAYSLMMVFAVTSILSIIQIRLYQLKRKNIYLEQKIAERTEKIEKQKHLLEIQKNRLKELDKMKSTFFTNITHEFRTPLTLIQGPLADVYNNKYGKISTIGKNQLSIAMRSIHRLYQLIDQLLHLSKLEAKKLSLTFSESNLIAFINSIVQPFKTATSHNQKPIDIQFLHNADLVILPFDADKLEIVISNLIQNAIKFSSDKAKITISIKDRVFEETGHPNHPFIELQISDNGIGIAQKDLPFIFDRFYQASHSSQSGGSGIGLALVKEIIELHGGSVAVQSVLGQGTTFTILLPKEHTESMHKTSQHGSGQIHYNVSTSRLGNEIESVEPQISVASYSILLVDDDADMLEYLQEHLRSSFKLITAKDGKEGLIKARMYIPDLIISDIMMPIMDGYAFCQQIKSDENLATIPFLFLTAKTEENDLIRGLKIRADGYITKPFNPDEIKIRVSNMLLNIKQFKDQYSQHIIGLEWDALEPVDKKFLKSMREIVENHRSDHELTIRTLADAANLSERQLRRKIKSLTGLSPLDFIRKIRLSFAKALIERKAVDSIKELAYSLGFDDAVYFSKIYKSEFGESPYFGLKKADG